MKRLLTAILMATLFMAVGAAQSPNLSENIYTPYTDSVVSIRSDGVAGTGFLYGSEGYIITNNHVVNPREGSQDRQVEVRFDGGGWQKADIVATDFGADLAVIKPERVPEGLNGLSIAESYSGEEESVGIIGNSYVFKDTVLTGDVVGGDYTAVTVEGIELENSIRISAPISPGHSGGPVLTPEGKVIGVISARKIGRREGIAISASAVHGSLSEMLGNKPRPLVR